eukprot:gene10964-11119_t
MVFNMNLQGNTENYYHPRHVINRAQLYSEGDVGAANSNDVLFIDVFNQGKILDGTGIRALLERAAPGGVVSDFQDEALASLLPPMSFPAIMVRMLNNLLSLALRMHTGTPESSPSVPGLCRVLLQMQAVSILMLMMELAGPEVQHLKDLESIMAMAELALRIGSQRDCNLLLLERLSTKLPDRLQSLRDRLPGQPPSLPLSTLAVVLWAAEYNVFIETGARIDSSRLKDGGAGTSEDCCRASWAASYQLERACQLRKLQLEWFEPDFELDNLSEQATVQQQQLDGWPQVHLQQGRFYDAWWQHVNDNNGRTDSIKSEVQEARSVTKDAVYAVTMGWVEACITCNKQAGTNGWESSRHLIFKQVPTEPYRLQPLSGLVISATNFSGRGERELLQQQIEAAGATYSAEMHKGVCSHLICKFAKGEKYRHAQMWGSVHIVSDAWIQASTELGYPAPEEKYKPSNQAGQASSVIAAAAAAAGCSGPAHPQPIIEGAAFVTSLKQPAVMSASAISGSVISGVELSSGHQQQQQQQTATMLPPAAKTGRLTRAAATTTTGAVNNEQAKNQQQFRGVCYPVLSASVTHIMVGAQASLTDLHAIRKFREARRTRVEIVTPKWLQLCHQQQQLLPADSSCRIPLDSLLRNAGPAAGGNLAAALAGQASDASSRLASVPSTGGGGSPDHQAALNTIRMLGGQVFNADSHKPSPAHPKVFAVCPISLTAEEEQSLRQSDASFQQVHPSCKVTLFWINICKKANQLVRITPRAPLMAPLRYKVPLPGFAAVLVSVAGYDPDRRATISDLVRKLGGSVLTSSDKKSSSAITHLIIPRWGPDPPRDGAAAAAADNAVKLSDRDVRKIVYARRHNVYMVMAEWLLDCAAEGRRVAETHYKPAGDVNLLQASQQSRGCEDLVLLKGLQPQAAVPGRLAAAMGLQCRPPEHNQAAASLEVLEMSQQVGYDVGDNPEQLLAAGRHRRRAGSSDEMDAAAKGAMLAQLSNLKKTGS